MAAILWRWAFLPRSERGDVSNYDPENVLPIFLAYYFRGAFHRENSAPSSGWWCDAVYDYSIAWRERTMFRIVGVADWGGAGRAFGGFLLAPVEFEMHFRSVGELDPARVIARFGAADEFGEIRTIPLGTAIDRVLADRPKRDEDWALAIELT